MTDIEERVETARLLVELVDDYVPPSKRGGARRAIRSLLRNQDPTPEAGCRRCGAPVDQKPGRGRPRIYCTTCSPRRKPGRKKPEK